LCPMVGSSRSFFPANFQSTQAGWHNNQPPVFDSVEEEFDMEEVPPEVLLQRLLPNQDDDQCHTSLSFGGLHVHPANLDDPGELALEQDQLSGQTHLSDIDSGSAMAGPSLSKTESTANPDPVWSALGVDVSFGYTSLPQMHDEGSGSNPG
jgi:hypothetical protein